MNLFKREMSNTKDLLRSEHIYLFHLPDNGKDWLEYTCLNCALNIRFDPEFNHLYAYPKSVPDENLKCDGKVIYDQRTRNTKRRRVSPKR